MKFLLIYRAPEYSPNNVQADAAILDAVAERLTAMNHLVVSCQEGVLPDDLDGFDVILHMARRMETLLRLDRQRHVRVLNAPHGVLNVAKSRELTLMLLDAASVPVPGWWAFDPEQDDMFVCDEQLQQLLPGWVKAMRAEGARPDDVTYVASPLEADSRIIELSSQSVPDIVLTQHLEGDLLKCYCVCLPGQNEASIWWFYPQESGYSKFGNAEVHNSELLRIPFAEAQLRLLASQISQALDLQVFGFDAIVQPVDAAQGEPLIKVIDVNDWPTFGKCRDAAADAIARIFK